VITRFNGYFNAKEIMTESEQKIDLALPDDYTQILPVYKELPIDQADLVATDMDLVVQKCAKVITKNSIKKRGKEYTKWIDDCYFLMGKAYYYKNDFAKSYKLLNQAARKYKDQESRFDARLWLARLYAKEENYDKALKYLSHLESDKELPERLKLDISKMYTSIYLAQGNAESAVSELQTAISHAKKKDERLRLTYLLGQLYKEQEERQESMRVFARVLKMHPEYKMEFYTRIQMAMAYSIETGGAEGVRKELMKMLRDEKYIEFQDQIYYALAEMSYNEHDLPQTIDYLEKSTIASVDNDNQKTKSFLRLGQIYFKEPDYPKAQANYDSCVTYMPTDFPNGEVIRNLSNNLKDLVAQIIIIETQDSLQMVAKMDPDEREDLITDLIQQRVDEEERKILEEQNKTEAIAGAIDNPSAFAGGPGGPGGFGSPGSGSNKWYFYNPTTREAGKQEFSKLWGKRINENNWRRSSKEQTFDDPEADDGEDFFVNEDGDTLQITGDWLDPNYYLKDLPITEDQVNASNGKIIEAYYALSIIYKDQMDDTPMSISTLEELNNRFHPHQYTVDTYYRLYRMYLDESDLNKSNYYKNKILSEYSDSQYAQVIRDPDFLERENEDYIEASKIYQKAYIKYYKRGYYAQTIETCNSLISKYGHTRIKPKAMFLRALAFGHEDGEDALRRELNTIASKYSDDEYGIKAQQILSGLNIKVEDAKAKELADTQQKQMEVEVEKMNYTLDLNSKHNFVILIQASGKDLSDIKSTISNYNRSNFKMEGLKMSAIIYQKGVHMITIKSFKNAKQANVYKIAFENTSVLESITSEHTTFFIVSYMNYALFYKPKDHVNYKKWATVKYKDL
jgi:tetratricopeptide (TPR) repeat protein